MQLTKPARRRRLGRALGVPIAGLLLAASLLHPAPTLADGATGTVTGELELRGNYYWERSTRVIAPEVRARLDMPNGVVLRADYLVDAITSASVAAGTLVDVRFTEVRHQPSLGVSREFSLPGQRYITLGARTTLSFEPDYQSYGAGVQAALALNQRATVFSASVAYVHDEIDQLYRDGSGIIPRNVGAFHARLDGVALRVSWDQVLLPFLTSQFGYDYSLLLGYLANPYRTLPIEGQIVAERHPDRRQRHTLHGKLAAYIRPTHSAVHLLYRAYVDTWRIAALNPEVRFYQELGPIAQLRLRYRYYRQTAAFFYANPATYHVDDPYLTADPKMSAFRSHQVGAQLRLNLLFFRNTPLQFLGEGHFNVGLDLVWSNSAYGNAVISQIGLQTPF